MKKSNLFSLILLFLFSSSIYASSCSDLFNVISLDNHFDKFSLSAEQVLDLELKMENLDLESRLRVSSLISKLSSKWKISNIVRFRSDAIYSTLESVIDQKGLSEKLIFKMLINPTQVTLTEKRALYLLINHKWWYSTLPLSSNNAQSRVFNSLDQLLFKIIKKSNNSILTLLKTVEQDRTLQTIFKKDGYLLTFYRLIQNNTLSRKEILNVAHLLKKQGANNVELNQIEFLLGFSGTEDDLLKSLPYKKSTLSHLVLISKEEGVPFAISLVNFYLLTQFIEKGIEQYKEHFSDLEIEQTPLFQDQSNSQAEIEVDITQDQKRELMRKFNAGEISPQEFMAQVKLVKNKE